MTSATLTDRLSRTVDQIDAEARQLQPSKVALTLLFVLPFVLGWLAGLVVRALWAVFAWTWTAGFQGFRTALPAKSAKKPPS